MKMDATIYILQENKTTQQLETAINSTLNNVVSWLESVNFRVNLEKTKFLLFHYIIFILISRTEGNNLQEIKVIKFLGITIDIMFLPGKLHTKILNPNISKISKYCYDQTTLSISSLKSMACFSSFKLWDIFLGKLCRSLVGIHNARNVFELFIPNLESTQSLRSVFKDPAIYILEMYRFVKNNRN